MFVIVT